MSRSSLLINNSRSADVAGAWVFGLQICAVWLAYNAGWTTLWPAVGATVVAGLVVLVFLWRAAIRAVPGAGAAAGILQKRDHYEHERRLDTDEDCLPRLQPTQDDPTDPHHGGRGPDHHDRAALRKPALHEPVGEMLLVADERTASLLEPDE